MRKFIFSGLDFCDPKQLFVFLNRQVTRWVFFCGLTTGIAPARAAICFLPDCMDKVSQTEGGNISSTCGSGCTASTVAGYVCEAPF